MNMVPSVTLEDHISEPLLSPVMHRKLRTNQWY